MELLSKLIFVKPENIKSTICTRMVDKKTKLNDIGLKCPKNFQTKRSMAICSNAILSGSTNSLPTQQEDTGNTFTQFIRIKIHG